MVDDFLFDDAAGKMTTITTGGATAYKEKVEVELDDFGRPMKTTNWAWTSGAFGASRAWERGYDDLGRLEWVEDPLGVRQEWEYDALHRITKSKRVSSDTSDSDQVTTLRLGRQPWTPELRDRRRGRGDQLQLRPTTGSG